MSKVWIDEYVPHEKQGHIYDDTIDSMRYFIALKPYWDIERFARDWWYENMSLLDKFIYKFIPRLSEFNRMRRIK